MLNINKFLKLAVVGSLIGFLTLTLASCCTVKSEKDAVLGKESDTLTIKNCEEVNVPHRSQNTSKSIKNYPHKSKKVVNDAFMKQENFSEENHLI